jgi:prephenate dehydrogenase
MGGSIARQARRAGIPTILGWSPEPVERSAAARDGVLDDAPAAAELVAERAELLVLAAPPAANRELLARLGPRLAAGALATDVGSVKRAIVAQAAALGLATRFAGSHPMTGTHEQGFAASRAGMFCGVVVYVTPAHGGEAAAREVAHFWETVLEAHAVLIDAARHDAQVAVTSQVPQIVASLLARFLAAHMPPGATLGPGARDTTRLAGSNPALWTEIVLLNRDELLPALRSLEQPLGEIERALETGDARAVYDWLAAAAQWRQGIER